MARTGHRVRDVAEQSGLSTATVDRVLHGRTGASPRAVRAVEQALLELDRQATQLRLARRTVFVDVVLDAPGRFRDAVRDATEEALPSLRPATVRARFRMGGGESPAAVAALVDAVGTGGRVSHGLVLKAPDDPLVAAAVRRAADRGIPTVTLVTDLAGSGRVAYAGLDNAAAGATAAHLLTSALRDRPGPVLATVSHRAFLGEQERLVAFERRLAADAPGREVLRAGDVHGADDAMAEAVAAVLARRPDVVGVYSMGGGNAGTAAALGRAGLAGIPFVGHDLDADNLPLLRSGVLTAVLHHDLRADLRTALTQLLRAQHLLPGAPTSVPSSPQVVTPWNIPPRLRG
ncbi:LacI family DNA-binding transcriptional regulator [Phycicoccus sonneratiae]|uniref:Substrate-binding domain-containing protein n=1 Tax=Phycicoccus sonneratiae TaxID=2807628 RepID=A0ABS2CU37_9MICO|nr:substrate-binding domain-containing protein [Phycicoccus sonneraticus]MBM6402594.1 substrate-binding domain-containing protein [Phycicoccus sonneraticus]